MNEATFVGLKNFARLLQDKVFFLSIKNTMRIWIYNFVPQIFIALMLAGIFTFNRIRGMKFYRAVYYLPNLITAASVGLLFNLLFNGDKSVVNQLLLGIGLIKGPIGFLSNGVFAYSVVAYVQWWMWFGYTTILVMAGMATIDHHVYEAAMVDGANKLQTYYYITLPLIRPTLIYIATTSIIGGMQLFDVPAVLTDGAGAPQKSILTTAMYIYNQGFKSHNLGYASTVSVGLFIIVAVFFVITYRLIRVRRVNISE
jgi:multiple sugar transport system permease protein